jgi:hypothetical protein
MKEHKILQETYWITQRCATREHVIKTAECPWCTIETLKGELDAIEKAIPSLLDFRLGPKFDARGTYTQAKADEWSERVAKFAQALHSHTAKKSE